MTADVWDRRSPEPTPEVVEVITAALAKHMRPYGFKTARVRAGHDHDGDPVLQVEIDFDSTDVPFDVEVDARALRDVLSSLKKVGELRFPHLRHNFADGQKVEKSDWASALDEVRTSS